MPVDKHSLRLCTGFVTFLFCVAMWLPASYGLAAGDGPDGEEPVKEQLQPATMILPAPSVVRIDPDVSKALLALQELREELKGLRNALDLLAFDFKKLDQRQRDLYDDLDERLRRQERASVVTSANPLDRNYFACDYSSSSRVRCRSIEFEAGAATGACPRSNGTRELT